MRTLSKRVNLRDILSDGAACRFFRAAQRDECHQTCRTYSPGLYTAHESSKYASTCVYSRTRSRIHAWTGLNPVVLRRCFGRILPLEEICHRRKMCTYHRHRFPRNEVDPRKNEKDVPRGNSLRYMGKKWSFLDLLSKRSTLNYCEDLIKTGG